MDMPPSQTEHKVVQVKAWSFLIAMAICSLIHGFVPGWLTFFSLVCALLWTAYGYKRLFGGWPDVLTLRQSMRGFALAACWPLVSKQGHA
ncbi:hypothetical protein KDW22_24710 [Burkholderia cenocepacia]|nr:hypothetical protein [Burkholderia cenocepacia]